MNARGFTVIEVLLSVTILSVIAGLSLSAFQGLQRSQELVEARTILTEALRQAQTQALAGKNDSAWGVRWSGVTVTLFAGASYAGRNPLYDQSFVLPRRITLSGTSEVDFAKLTGTAGASIITVTGISSANQVTVSSLGVITD